MMHYLKIWLGISLIMMIQMSTSLAASISKDVGVLAVLDLAGPEELPYNERVRLAVEKWTKDEQKCHHGEFWYKGKCHSLNFDSELCDRKTEVIVLEKPKERGTKFSVKPICKKVECGFDSVWWPQLDKCVRDEEADRSCGEHGHVEFDIFDDTFCECAPASGNLFQDDKCYKFYSQGPCDDGQLFKPSDNSPVRGKCVPKVEPINVNKEDVSVKLEKKSSSGVTEELVKPEGTEESVKPEITEELVKSEETEKLVKPEGIEESVKPEVTEELAKSEEIEKLVKPEGTEQSVKPKITEELVKPEGIEESVKPEGIEESVKPEVTEELVKSEEIKKLVKPEGTEQSVKPKITEELVKPEITAEPVKSEVKVESVNPEIDVESVKPEVDSVDPEISLDSVRPETRINFSNENSTVQSVKVEEAAAVSKAPEISVESVKNKLILESVNIRAATAIPTLV